MSEQPTLQAPAPTDSDHDEQPAITWRQRKGRRQRQAAMVVVIGGLLVGVNAIGPSPQDLEAMTAQRDEAQTRAASLESEVGTLQRKVDGIAAREATLATGLTQFDEMLADLTKRETATTERETAVSAAEVAKKATEIPGAGTYLVGTDIQAGQYRSAGSEGCYWARLRSTSGRDIIANGLSDGPQVVTISASDAAFETSRCGTWTKVS